MTTEGFEDVLQFWFPNRRTSNLAVMVRQWEWWFCSCADAHIIKYFSPLLERAGKVNLMLGLMNPARGSHLSSSSISSPERFIEELLEHLHKTFMLAP